jgi:3-oxoacyl-[acyl-carrier protein] reductase
VIIADDMPSVNGREFSESRVIVTGGASGFGAALARSFAAEGAFVLVADIDRRGAEKVAAELPAALSFEVDVSSEDGNRAMAAKAVEAWGGIDILCANAGLPHPPANLVDLPPSTFDKIFAVNVRGLYLAAKHCVPHMGAGSSIIATGSIGAIRPRAGLTAYYASKGAVNTLVQGLAVELAPAIRVNALLPVSAATGFDEKMFGSEMPERLEQAVIKGIPMGRRATPDDLASAALFLASPRASFITGVCLNIDGGRSIS